MLNFQQSLDWHLLEYKSHKGVQTLVKDLNKLYKKEPALYQKQFEQEGFEWIDYNDAENSVLVYIRKGNNEADNIFIACNMTPIPRENYRIGLPKKGKLEEIFNSDLKKYFGTGKFKNNQLTAQSKDYLYRKYSVEIVIPPLGAVAFKYSK